MGLHCGIVGLTNVGKTTIFNCFSETKAQTSNYAFSASKSNIGKVDVPDPRLLELTEFQPTDKIVPATVDIVDLPGLTKGASQGEGVGNKFLGDLRNSDAIIHVIRCFDDEELPHIEGSVDPVRDIEILDFELQVKDLDSVEKKLIRLQKIAKSGDKDAKHGIEVLNKLKEHLENFENARSFEVSEEDKKHLYDMFLLTVKPVMYVCNVDDASATTGNAYAEKVKEHLKDSGAEILILAAQLESEIAELEDEEDRKVFLEDAGLAEPGVDKLLRSAYSLLNLQTFFTIGQKENRAWTVRKGAKAPEAAGVIHSDLERGFIRAEVIKYADFVELGSEQAAKLAGKLYVEGKNYVVEDGDLLNIRFNV